MKIGVDYIGTSAGIVIVGSDGKIFMAQRGRGARDDVDKWEFPGGTISLFESRERAAQRNVLDKYGIKVGIDKILGVYDVIDKKRKDHWVSTTFTGRHIKGTPRILYPAKCRNIGWFSLDEIGKMDLSRITRLNYRDLIAEKKISKGKTKSHRK
jgi:ADP-ribose pyrophosphatase YjhB (NUDIX family)